MKRNPALQYLKSNYLFPEINARKQKFLKEYPEAALISLGIGDTTLAIPPFITQALVQASAGMGTKENYRGYGPEQGIKPLRESIASKIYSGLITADEVFIADGAKCDLGRLQTLFGPNISIAVQDPAYPVYVEGSIIQGVRKIIPMLCSPENNFFPDFERLERPDLIYFCSPNNPTGAAATKEQLGCLVHYAKANRSIIIFDAAYAHFIQDRSLPKSIYEIEGAKEVAIELGSFSKLAGFTGIRLGWTVIPRELKFDDESSVRNDWNRLTTTIFNGASYISQMGGCASLETQGMTEIHELSAYYLENAKLLSEAFNKLGYEVYGGQNAPYLWVRMPGIQSWDAFEHFLHKHHIVTTPGAGFGEGGEGFIRITGFGQREDILKAIKRLLT